jgi:hypothetical protein
MMNRRRIHTVPRFLPVLVVLVLAAGGAVAPVQAAPTQRIAQSPAATITHIGDIGTATIKDSSTVNLVVTTTAAVAAGDDIIIAYATDPSQDLTVTVSDGANTYQQVAMGISSGNMRTYIFAAYNVSALSSGSSITIKQTVFSSTAVANRAAVVSVFRGLAPSGALEQTNTASSTTNSTAPNSGNATTIQANQLLIGVIGAKVASTDTFAWATGWTAGPRAGTTGGSSNETVALGYQVVSAADAYAASGTLGTSGAWVAVIATFKATDAGISYIGNIGGVPRTTLAVSTTADVAAGDDIVITFAMDPTPGTVSVADAWGNTYNLVADVSTTGGIRTLIFAAYNVTALPGGSIVTITHPNVVARAAALSVFHGLDDSGALDQTKTATGSGTTPSSGATATTTQAEELLIGAVGTEGPVGDPVGTWSNSFIAGPRAGTALSTADANVTASMGYRVVTVAGAYTAAKTGITSRDWAAAIATFKGTGISWVADIGSAASSVGTSLAVVTTAAVTAGDDIIVTFAVDGDSGAVSVADSGGTNTYSQVANAQVEPPSNANVRSIIFAAYDVDALPAGSTINIVHLPVGARSALVTVFRGLADGDVLDQTKTATATASGTAVDTGATDTTTQVDELLIGAVGVEGPNVDAPGIYWQNAFTYGPRLGTSWGSSAGGDTDVTAQMGWRIVGATGAYQAQITLGTSRDWAAAIATFKGAPAITCYALTLGHTGSGTTPVAAPANSTGCPAGQYVSGENISLSGATPDTGWGIASWSGTANNDSTAGTNSLTMPAGAHSAGVNYAQACYALTLGHTGSGTTPVAAPANSTGCPAGQYVSGENISLSGATPATGWGIASWSGTANNDSTAGTNSLAMPASAHSAGVNYAQACYALTLGHTGNGTTPVATPANSTGCPADQYVFGENISLSGATPATGWGIASWSGTTNNASTAGTNSLSMPASGHSAGVDYLRLLGDVNSDGDVNSTDALIVLSADAGVNTSQQCPMNYGDVNGDGLVNSTDALIILSYDAEMTVPFLVGQPALLPTLITQPAGCRQ